MSAPEGKAGTNTERTFIAIKPDGVQRGLIGNIIGRFETKGFKLVAMKLMTPTLQQAEGHYADLSKKGFFKGLCTYFSSGPICAMVWEGQNAIKTGRTLLGATNPADSLPGTIRGDLCIDVGRNICHGSDGPDSAKHEINFWFTAAEINNYSSHSASWIYEDAGEPAPAAGGDAKADAKAAKKAAKAAAQAEKAAKLAQKKIKAVEKEGGKKGQDIEGMGSLGSSFFNILLQECKGSAEHLRLAFNAMNTEVDPAESERKGGAGPYAKAVYCVTEELFCAIFHVPQQQDDKNIKTEQWVKAATEGIKIDMKVDPQNPRIMFGEMKHNPDNGQYSLKDSDTVIAQSFRFLRERNLVVDDESDDEDYSGKAGLSANANTNDY